MTIDIEKFYIDSTDRSIYDRLEKEFPKKMSKKDLFMFALLTGYKNGNSSDINKRLEFFWASNLKPDDEVIIKSIAISEEKGIDVLQNVEQYVEIAQKYAHGGISVLKEKFDEYGSFIKYIEKEIEESYRELQSEESYQESQSKESYKDL